MVGGVGKGISAMPTPGSRKAPRFEGDVEELLEFFVEFEELAGDCQLKEEDKVKMVVRYVPKETRKFWKSLEGYKAGKYDDLRNGVLAEHPGADKGEKYTRLLRKISTDSDMVGRKEYHQRG